MTRLDTDLGTHAFDDILAATEPSPLITTVKLAASETPLTRGTVIASKTADGQFKALDAAIADDDVVLVLADDVEKAEADDVATAYKTGNFVRDRLVANGEYELAAADFEALRDAGIQTTGMIEGPAGLEAV